MVMFLLSNLAYVILLVCVQKLINEPSNSVWVILNAVTTFLFFGLLSVANWMFSYEYFKMVRIIPFVLDNIPPP